MRAMRHWSVWFVILLAAHGWADKPFLWKVDGGGPKPSYLFGSIHIPSPAVTNLPPSVERALQAADVVCCELPFDDATMLKVATASMSAQTPLSQVLPAELYARTETELRRVVPGFQLALLERAEVWTVCFMLAMFEYQMRYPAVQPLDLLLYQRAQAAGKETGGLETADEQMAAMNSFTTEEHVEMLRATLDELADLRKRGLDPVKLLLDAYLAGDAAAVDKEVQRSYDTCSPALQKRFDTIMLADRNRTMADRIRSRLAASPQKSCLFVVGALHGLGKGSVVDLLQQSGVTVERVNE